MNVRPVSVLSLLITCIVAAAAPGQLDLSFGTSGVVRVPPYLGATGKLAVQKDGRFYLTTNSETSHVLAGFTDDGTPDLSFNATGVVESPFIKGQVGNILAVDADGRIITAGSFPIGSAGGGLSEWRLSVTRYLPNGGLDTTFGVSGQVLMTTVAEQYATTPTAVVIQSDGKILISGYTRYCFAIIRLNANGTPDQTFNTSGVVYSHFNEFQITKCEAWGIGVQGNGQIVVCGAVYSSGGSNRIGLIRLNADGSPDTTFAAGGNTLNGKYLGVGLRGDYLECAIQPDDKILVAGQGREGPPEFLVQRYLASGLPDVAFSQTGTARIVFNEKGSQTASSVFLQPDGKVVAAGTTSRSADPPNTDIAIARLNPDGSLDSTFNLTGKLTHDIAAWDAFETMVMQKDGRILLAGHVAQPENRVLTFVRFHGLSGPDISVERGSGMPLLNGALPPLDLGPVLQGASLVKEFTIRNDGLEDLKSIAIGLADGGAPGVFTTGGNPSGRLDAQESTIFALTFTPNAPGNFAATIRVASDDPDENPFDIHITGRQATPLDVWRNTYFGNMENTGPGSDLSDPDDDGLPNLVEYATGKNPVLYSAPVGELIKNGNSLEFTYWRSKSALTEVSFIREFSQTISGVWSQTAGMVETILSDDGNMQQVLITTPAGIAGKRFVRLRVIRL